MRLTAFIAAVCLVVLGAAGWLYARALRPPPGKPATVQVDEAVRAFVLARSPELVVDLEGLFGQAGRWELVDPAWTVPFVHRLAPAAMRGLFAYARSCRVEDLTVTGDLDAATAKVLAWTRYACGQAPVPGDEFFQAPPFMHPSGRSYVA